MEKIEMQPVREKVVTALRKAIFEGELVDGQEITQEEIANKLGISRMPVREAFRILETDGLLKIMTRKAVVLAFTEDDFKDNMFIRSVIEGEAAARACIHHRDFSRLEKIQEKMKEAIKNKDLDTYVQANIDFHGTIWDYSQSNRFKVLLNQTFNGIMFDIPLLVPGHMEKSIQEHEKIIEALKSGSPERAAEAMRYHISRGAGNFVDYRSQFNLKDL